jgi:predicted HTH transcriptional regulator
MHSRHNTEDQHLEFKRELTDKLEKEVVAFLNSRDGGVILLGVDDSGKVLGLEDVDGLQLQIKDRLKHNIMPSTMGLFDLAVENQDGKSLIKLIVASGSEKPYYLSKMGMSAKGCFIRIGSASEPMPIAMIEDLFSRRLRNSIGAMVSRRQNLHFEQLKIYYSESQYALNDQFAHNLELLTRTGEYNYAAYLLADQNGCSIKVAKYAGTTRVDLIENEEYGYCCMVKATKAVLEKLRIENKTFTKITASKRLEQKLIDPVALREAVINAIIHNDFSHEVPPKFELFADRLEITSTGSLPPGFNQQEFFQGFSVPHNKELMRVFKDLDLVEQMGSGIIRILQHYPPTIYQFSQHFIRVVLPYAEGYYSAREASDQVSDQASDQVSDQADRLLNYCQQPRTITEIMAFLGVKHRSYFRKNVLNPLIEAKRLSLTLPDKPSSPKQQYITILAKDERYG